MWQQSKFFKDKFYLKGSWKFSTALSFPHCSFLGADTETKMYLNDVVLSDEDAYRLYLEHGQEWIKKNIEVRAYAYMISDGDNFALFTNADDFLTCCAMMNVKVVFWYNARFDFAIFDYYFLTHKWIDVTDITEDLNHYKKMPTDTYQSLNGEFGQRYSMTIWKEYTNRRSQRKVHKFKMLDICNIFGGGLAKNLEDWKIKDHEDRDVRKLEMNYSDANIDDDNDIQYMINDTKGLYLLAEKIQQTMKDITGFDLFEGDYMTAGGLAKKTLLQMMFDQDDNKQNIKAFKLCFPMTAKEDQDYRNKHLYMGGKCFVNPFKVGIVHNLIYKYDVNSMYPDKMRNMSYPFGNPTRIDNIKKFEKGKCYILAISNVYGCLRSDMIPVWQDAYTHEYVNVVREQEQRYIWLEELQEMEQWYLLDYDVDFVLEFEKRSPKGVKDYVDKFYNIKSTQKGSIKQGAKLLLNSAYGKIAQKIDRDICVYKLNEDGIVHLEKVGEQIDEKSMLSVVVGSRITALARVNLLHYIREICKGDVKNNFIYCDTDSVHALVAYDKCDDHELGKMKCEGIYEHAIYLAPKTYLLYNKDEGFEVHSKGVNTQTIEKMLKDKSFKEATEIFRPNQLFKCLCGMNVKGGKALVYVNKTIVNNDFDIDINPLDAKEEMLYD